MGKVPKTKAQKEWWKIGFEAGLRETMRRYEVPIKLGAEIINVLDERYEFNKN